MREDLLLPLSLYDTAVCTKQAGQEAQTGMIQLPVVFYANYNTRLKFYGLVFDMLVTTYGPPLLYQITQ